MKLEFVTWIDSRMTSGWAEIEDRESTIWPIKSVGWVVKETDELIHLVPHIGTNPDQGCGDMMIPKIAITRRIVLKEPK